MSVTDAAILSAQAEGVLLVVKAESVPRKAAMDARDKLLEVNATLLGAVFNNIQTQRDGYFCNSYYRYHCYHSYYTGKDDGLAPRHRRPTQPGPLVE
jgi:Mrp family chromosome partitioning ATPase